MVEIISEFRASLFKTTMQKTGKLNESDLVQCTNVPKGDYLPVKLFLRHG